MLACHGCLKHGCKLYDIRLKGLEGPFSDLTGLPVSGGRLCGICMHLLLKFQDFRVRCINSYHVLNCMPQLNNNASKTIDRSNITAHLSRSTICHVKCEPCRVPTTDMIIVPDDTEATGSENYIKTDIQNETAIYKANTDDKTDVFTNEVEFMDMEESCEIISDSDDDVKMKMEDLDDVETNSVKTDTDVADDDDKITNIGDVDQIFKQISPAESDDGCAETTMDELDDNTEQIIDNKDDNVIIANIHKLDKTNINNVVDSSIETDEDVDYLDSNTNVSKTNIEDAADVMKPYIHIAHNSHVDTGTNESNEDCKETNTIKSVNKPAKTKLDEDKSIMTNLFRRIWKDIDKKNDDYYQMFERLYNFSQLEEKPKQPEIDFKIKYNKIICGRGSETKGEMYYFKNFLKLNKEIANSYNFDVDIINVMEERKAMEKKRKNLTEDSGQCKMCLKSYLTGRTRERHMKLSHNEAYPFRCEVCMYTFRREKSLLLHIFKYHCSRRKCRECDKTVFSEGQKVYWHEVIFHVDMHHRHTLTTCEFCGRTFTAQKHCYFHIRQAHRAEMNAVQCLLCGDSYNGLHGLRQHMVRIHAEAVKCATCGEYYQNKEVMEAHISETGECLGVSACPMCGALFPTKSLMRGHYDEVHAKYKCNKCNMTFIENESYKMHRFRICAKDEGLNQTRQKKKKTPRSPKKREPKIQRIVDNSIKMFICDICGNRFKDRATLGYHMRIHTGEKPYKCEICDKNFRIKTSLKRHILTHTGERPYKCKLCPKTFRQPTHLQAHMPSHTHEQKYACNLCEKRYTSKVSLRDHIQSVHMGVPVPPRHRKRKAKTK